MRKIEGIITERERKKQGQREWRIREKLRERRKRGLMRENGKGVRNRTWREEGKREQRIMRKSEGEGEKKAIEGKEKLKRREKI